ncbi:MAG TPA: radical SAM family heme chaperone HemW [Pseudomonadales bacterium]|nr:radical SAM family heme chaperone HemW [Pseudomonadales bacterium]
MTTAGRPGAGAAPELPPLSLYIHVPWCVRKCPYCDFNSHALRGELPEQAYADRVVADLTSELEDVAGRPIGTLFFGGGTPSLLSPATIGDILERLQARVAFAADAEITLEANPGTAEAGRFRGYRAAGVNRLSIGVQSFSDAALQRLGRIHDGDEAGRALHLARAAGFERINLDLMHGLPGQDPTAALADLEHALDLGVDHLSWYQLTIEPNTEFHSRPPLLPVEEALEDIEAAGIERLAGAGLERYEVSAWAREGEACRHNLNYWRFGDYLGLGPGAHGKLTRRGPEGLEIVRTQRTRAPGDWLGAGDGAPRRMVSAVAPAERRVEFMLNVLRLSAGVDEALFEARTGLPLAAISETLAALRAEGLMRAHDIALTPLGSRFLDRVVGRFLD